MKGLHLDQFTKGSCPEDETFTFEDYVGEQPRWCKGCGDYAILTALEKTLAKEKIPANELVCVSGIGCSSRFPYYLKTFGFHGIHGRALPISMGVNLANPNLKVVTIMGDGDCFSIGLGHWIHALRYNPNLLVLVFDNEIYGLTKKQTSPTTPLGTATRTTPKGPYLQPLDPIKLIMGATGVSFVAQTATWMPAHLSATIERGFGHQGLSFIRVLQRCPMFSPQAFGDGGKERELFQFITGESGIPVDTSLVKLAGQIPHDHTNFKAAQKLANQKSDPDVPDAPSPLGLIFEDSSLPTYDEIRLGSLPVLSPTEKAELLLKKLEPFGS